MKALYKSSRAPGLELVDVPEPKTGMREVKIRVLKTGICGTDLHIESWDAWADENLKPPFILGHEFVGRVSEIGAEVTTVKVGDLVSGEPLQPAPLQPNPLVRLHISAPARPTPRSRMDIGSGTLQSG